MRTEQLYNLSIVLNDGRNKVEVTECMILGAHHLSEGTGWDER